MDEKAEYVSALTFKNQVEVWDANKGKIIGEPFSVSKEFSFAEIIGDEGVVFCNDRSAGQFFDASSGAMLSPLLRGYRLEVFYYPENNIYIVASRRSSVIHLWKKELSEFEAITQESTFDGIAVNKADT